MDFQSVQDWKSNELSKAEYGRMPWHDVAMGVIGPCVYDIAQHFVLRWNFCKRDKYKRDENYDWLVMEGTDGENEDLVAVQRPKYPVGAYIKHPLSPLDSKPLKPDQGTVHAQIVRSSADWSSGILTEHSIQNAYIEVIRNAQHFVYIENQFFSKWNRYKALKHRAHHITVTATGDQQSPIHNQVGSAIVDACVRAGKEGRKFRVIIIIPAIPGFAGDLRSEAATGTRAIMDYQYKSINRGEHSIFGQIQAQGVDPTQYIFVFNLRSYDRLNFTAALKEQEEKSGVKYREVQRANAEDIMSSGLHSLDPTDSHDHIIRGHHHGSDDAGNEERERFVDQERKFEAQRKAVGLEGDDRTPSKDSIAEDALDGPGKVSDEKWDDDNLESERDNFVQEELYIHGKLCIVDDKIVICGSSNINDRSQLGFHDSELTIVMEDTKLIESTMNGQPYTAGHHAASLRRILWREHLGLVPPQPMDASRDPNAQPPGDGDNNWLQGDAHDAFVTDPLSDALWETWTGQATTNTEVFRWLFHADPDDNIKTFEDYKSFIPKESGNKQGHLHDKYMPAETVRAELDKIRGHLVWYPLEFLRDADMAERGLQVNEFTESIYT